MTMALANRNDVHEMQEQRGQGGFNDDLLPAMSMEQATQRYNALVSFVKSIMQEGKDFGKVPGTEKNTLLKPGAEKLATFFGLTTKFIITEKIEDWSGAEHGGEPLFYYVYRCQMYRRGNLVAESDGSCNSRETKFRWRWVKAADLPAHIAARKDTLIQRSGAMSEPEFAIRKRETTGRYGKPAEYWDRFDKAIKDGTAKKVMRPKKDGGEMVAWEIGETLYRVPNEEIPSLINTIQKMAQKRALVGTTLLAVNASEFFTQDVEDMEFVDAEFTVVPQSGGGNGAGKPGAHADDQRSHDEIFEEEWLAAAGERGFTRSEAMEILTKSRNKATDAGKKLDFGWHVSVLKKMRDGDFDKLLKKQDAEQGAADPLGTGSITEAEDDAIDAETVAGGNAGDNVNGDLPDPVVEAMSQDWDGVRASLREQFKEHMKITGRADAEALIALHAKWLGLAKPDAMTVPQRVNLFNAIKSQALNRADGSMKPQG